MTEREFIDSIDCRFPYQDPAIGRDLVLKACELSANAAFAVLDELARPGASVHAPVDTRQELISLLESTLQHPLVRVLVPIARRLVSGESMSVPEALECMNIVRKYPGQYAGLGLSYLSCDDRDGAADKLYDEIKRSWEPS